MNKQKISGLIDTAIKQPDVDNQYMAARDLCEELNIFYTKPINDEQPEDLLANVFDVFLHHLNSDYKDLQGIRKISNSQETPFSVYQS